jgi:tripartite-type tricarboxylate transporter receptor subunit TctC
MQALLLASAFGLILSSAVSASDYPDQSIKFIVPFAAGGPTDTLGRVLAEPMSKILGQSIVVENVVGAGGTIGVGRAVHAKPDGYTISVGNWSTHVINGAAYSLDYDLSSDLEPIALLPSGIQLIVGRKGIPASDLGELIGWLKQNPASVGTAGVGSAGHVSGLLFQKETGIQLSFVHYRGAGPAMTDLVGGHIDIMFDQSSNSLPHVREGRIKAYAVTSERRLPSAPEIPAVDEAGLHKFYIAVWHGLWAPKGTPIDVISKLNAAAHQAMQSSAVRERLTSVGWVFPKEEQASPEALARVQRSEIARWWPLLKAANIKSN